ncbi:MAG: hypothetical protein IJX53_07485 [Clostridia bacterium]|nr:hypothetical protein [Clostridia bacterium]
MKRFSDRGSIPLGSTNAVHGKSKIKQRRRMAKIDWLCGVSVCCEHNRVARMKQVDLGNYELNESGLNLNVKMAAAVVCAKMKVREWLGHVEPTKNNML